VDDRRGPHGGERRRRDPDDITICVAAPAYVGDDIAYMRDQCRWFGGMVGNHVADIVERYGETAAVPAALTDYIRRARGVRLQRHGKAGNTHTDVRARRDRRPVLHPRPEEAHSSDCRPSSDLGVDQFAIYLMHDQKDETLKHEVDPLVREQLLRQQAARADRRAAVSSSVRRVATFVAFIALLALGYVGYKRFGRAIDDAQRDWPLVGSLMPRTDDLTMPPLTDIITVFGDPAPGNDPGNFAAHLFGRALFTLREAAAGFVVGVLIGLMIAMLLAWRRRLEDAFLPYVIASQTIPLIAIAPIIVIWGRKNFDFFPFEWQDWMSVAVIATYLTFFPVAVNGLRGLKSPRPEHVELMESYAAGWGASLWRLRLPAAVPYLFAALKIAATASIVGAIVGEISAGVEGGLGRRILGDALNYTVAPARLYASVIAAALLGIFVFLVIVGAERAVLSRQKREVVS
jgi:NitT/TauT family transport system permease protein